MLSNTLSVEDEEAVQRELHSLGNEVVRYLHSSPLPHPPFISRVLQLAPEEEQKIPDRVAELPSVPGTRPAGKSYALSFNSYAYANVCAQKRNSNPNHNGAWKRRGENVYQLQHSEYLPVFRATLLYSPILHSEYSTIPRSFQNPAFVSCSSRLQHLCR